MLDKLLNLQYTNKLTILSMLLVLINPWLALLVGFTAACLEARNRPDLDLPRWALWVPGIILLLMWAFLHPMPQDDLGRHVTAWRIGFDYRAQYPLAEMPQANMWMGFDWLMYQIQRVTGATPVQLAFVWPGVMVALSYALFLFNCKRTAGEHSVGFLLLVVAVCYNPIASRALLGRPEFLYVLLIGTAFLVNSVWRKALWSIGFCLLIPTYWMGWSYAASVLLFDRQDTSLRNRIRNVALGGALAILHLAFWQWYTGDYLAIMGWLKRTLLHVVPTESMSLDQSLMSAAGLAVFVWLGMVLARFDKEAFIKHAPVLLLLAWLSFSNQVRFMAPIAMVAVPWLLEVTPVLNLTSQGRLMMLCLTISFATHGMGVSPDKQPRFVVPADALVVSSDPYAAVLYSQAGVRVEPSPAIGATPREVSEGVSEGRFDCAKAKQYGVTHLIEKTLPVKPACASLLEIQEEWRYWKID